MKKYKLHGNIHTYKITGNVIRVFDEREKYKELIKKANIPLSESEIQHLCDFAEVGSVHAHNETAFFIALSETLSDWKNVTKRKNNSPPKYSDIIDIYSSYNISKDLDSSNIISNLDSDAILPKSIPLFYVVFGSVFLALFCVTLTLFVSGMFTQRFFINPVYLVMFSVGSLGLLVTDIVAVLDWRKNTIE